MKLDISLLEGIRTSSTKSRILGLGIILLTIHLVSGWNNGFTTGPTVCVFKLLTGHPCPACGTTRAIAAISEGRFLDSITLNPLGVLILLLAVLWSLKVHEIVRFKKIISDKFWHSSLLAKTSSVSSLLVLSWVWNFSRW